MSNPKIQVRQSLFGIEQALKASLLWQSVPPDDAAFTSIQPFCLDSMQAEQWLQWVLLPRMHALLDGDAPLPERVAILPYFEAAFDGRTESITPLLAELRRFDDLFTG
ncbi:YqcC family protein [Musicola keenii]|uniref:YqcC family protein n=1 Tax=Musicola keenii TaxID=2884250 RepID=UPI0017833551|nr:YqcC family protein [Musicola keenii]